MEKGDAGPVIAIYTRQGGGNRECCCRDSPEEFAARHFPARCSAACNEALAAHPLYLRDADDKFDTAYATFYFRAPSELPAAVPADLRALLAEALAALPEAAGEPVNMDERWQAAIDRIGSGQLRPAETALADQLGALLSDPSPDSPKVMRI